MIEALFHKIQCQRKIIAPAIVVLVAIMTIAVRQLLYPEFTAEVQLYVFAFSLVTITVVWTGIQGINNLLNRLMPYEQGIIRRVGTQIVAGLIFMYLVRSAMFFLVMHQIPFDVSSIPIPINNSLRMVSFMIDTLLILAINFGYIGVHFFTEWKKALLRTERLQRERSIVQFENLKNQLNPHFLFNSLTSLNSLIYEDQQLASQFLQQLSKVYRYLLQNKEKELVSLGTEIQFIENYIFLLHTRFYGSLDIQVSISKDSCRKQIVPVTLQVLIENAIKHNVVNKDNPLTICICTQGNHLLVQNNLQRKKVIEYSNGMGLENMKTLYSYLSPSPVEIIEDAHTFTVKLPLLENSPVLV